MIFRNSLMTLLLSTALYGGITYTESTLLHDLSPTDGGSSVAISGEWVAVGAFDPANTSSCYVTMYKYDYSTMSWGFAQTLGSAKGNCSGNKGFGVSVSLSGTKLAVGLLNFDDGSDKDVGAYTTYEYDGVAWVVKNEQVVAATPAATKDNQALSGFGETLSIRGDYLVVGAPYYDVTGTNNEGKVYIYDWNVTARSKVYPTLATIDGTSTNDRFGAAVTGAGSKILVGAPGYSSNLGAGYLYDFDGTTATLDGIAPGMTAGGQAGQQVAMDSATIILSGTNTDVYTLNGTWSYSKTFNGTNGADVSISDGVNAIGYLGNKVELVSKLDSDVNPTAIIPSTVDVTQTAEDISLYKDTLAVKHSVTQPAYIYELPCGSGYDLTAYEWAMVGIPCAIPAGTTVSQAFNTNGSTATGDDLGTYGTNWVVYEQNSTYGTTSASYVELNASSPVTQGKGYWIISDRNVTTRVDSSISPTRTATDANLSKPVGVGTQSIVALPDGNATVLVSNNLPRSFQWGNIVIYVGSPSGVTPMNSPAAATVLQNATGYVYDATQTGQPYRAVSAAAPGLGDTIKAGEGFWVKVLEPNTGVELALPYEK